MCCDDILSSSNKVGICSKCKHDDNKTITATNAKKKFGLNNYDLDNEILHNFPAYSRNGTTGKKYFIEEIEAYIESMDNKLCRIVPTLTYVKILTFF